MQLAGFDVISEEQNNYDAKIYVRYTERTCGQYSLSIMANSGEPGTCIECFILTTHDKLGTIFKADISSRTPYSVGGHVTLYGAAIREFENEFEFKYLGESVAVALSRPPITSGLVEGLISSDASDRKKALQLLERAGWVPKTPEQKAMVAIASANWNDCISIGQPAAEPLSKLLKTRDRAKAAWALGEIGDKYEVNLLLGEIGDKRAVVNRLIETLKHEYVDDTEVKLQVIIALGKLKDNLALETLKNFLNNGNTKVAEAAKEAIENIRSQK